MRVICIVPLILSPACQQVLDIEPGVLRGHGGDSASGGNAVGGNGSGGAGGAGGGGDGSSCEEWADAVVNRTWATTPGVPFGISSHEGVVFWTSASGQIWRKHVESGSPPVEHATLPEARAIAARAAAQFVVNPSGRLTLIDNASNSCPAADVGSTTGLFRLVADATRVYIADSGANGRVAYREGSDGATCMSSPNEVVLAAPAPAHDVALTPADVFVALDAPVPGLGRAEREGTSVEHVCSTPQGATGLAVLADSVVLAAGGALLACPRSTAPGAMATSLHDVPGVLRLATDGSSVLTLTGSGEIACFDPEASTLTPLVSTPPSNQPKGFVFDQGHLLALYEQGGNATILEVAPSTP